MNESYSDLRVVGDFNTDEPLYAGFWIYDQQFGV